jgi:hypothetical protein
LIREEKYWLSHKEINNIIYRKCSQCEEWLIENNENFYFHNKKYPEKGFSGECKKCSSKRSREIVLKNHDKYIEYQIQWHIDNKKYHNTNKRQWHKDNKEKSKSIYKEFIKNNPDKVKQYSLNHRNHDITKKEWNANKNYFKNDKEEVVCAYCGFLEKEHIELFGKQLHKDHVIHDGYNDIRNCIPACYDCNCSKWQNDMEEWFKEQTFFTEDKLEKIKKWCNEDYKQYIELKPPYIIKRNRINNEDGTYYYRYNLYNVDEKRNITNIIFTGDKKQDILNYIRESKL